MSNSNMLRYLALALLFIPTRAHFQTLCEDGYAGIYPCQNVDLLAHVGPESLGGASFNVVWGWTDPLDGKEYVLLGMSTGVGFFDIADPTAPIYLGYLPTHTFNSIWRTFREYNNYLFVGSEANGHGLQVFDLTHLRNLTNYPVTFAEDAYYAGFGRCHTLAIEPNTGYLYACGTNTYAGSVQIVNIQNPLSPVLAGGYDQNGYTHEAQVLIYNGPDQDYVGHTIALCFNGNVQQPLTIVDVTDPTDATTISTTGYPGKSYCHQGWLTEDGQYMLMNDETDEYYNGYTATRTFIWDMHDLDNPVFMGYHEGNTTAIDHNNYIIGNLAYQSNYTAGLQILDVTNIAIAELELVGYFDHQPGSNAASFDGEWMNYPYFESGVVPLTDIGNGLYLVRPQFVRASIAPQVCATDDVIIDVELMSGFQGPFQVSFTGLPDGAVVINGIEALTAPNTGIVTIQLPDGYSGPLDMKMSVVGASHDYAISLSTNLIIPITYYIDADSDGFGNEASGIASCVALENMIQVGGDCDDTNETIFPGAPGTQENIDNNCNNELDPQEIDVCHDLDGDLLITVNDLFIFNSLFDCEGSNCLADFNTDGTVDTQDLIIILADFGEYCGE